MRILITNLFIAHNSGSETVVELLADGLRRGGHAPMLLAPTLGPQADRMRARGHVVVDRIAALPERPDLIHAQHTPVALSALAAFPDVPAVFACHSAFFEVEAPRPHPQILRWIAVDDLCRERCLSRGVAEDRLTVILNAVDFRRFVRRPALPTRPQRALLLSKNHGHQALVRKACMERAILLDEIGPAAGRMAERIEEELLEYDLVFATARMALEAASVGCAVIVCDARGFAGLLTRARLPSWRRLNFGAGLLTRPVTLEGLRQAIEGFDPDDAASVMESLRAEASIDDSIAQHLAVYAEALSEPAPMDLRARAAATAAWIEDLVPSAATRDWGIIAREGFGFSVEPTSALLQGMEQRLRDEIGQQAAAIQERIAMWPGELYLLGDRYRLAAKRVHPGAKATGSDVIPIAPERRWPFGSPLAANLSPPACSSGTWSAESEVMQLQLRAESITERAFLGVPATDFASGGREQLIFLLQAGLTPQSRLLDVGCGALRAGYWLIHFLQADRYCGIEPHGGRLAMGRETILEPGLEAAKRPRFDGNAAFNTNVFGEKFDFFLAYSIWTHASKRQLCCMLDGFLRDSTAEARFLASYLPADETNIDYQGEGWNGTSHESNVPGCIHHDPVWLMAECAARGLAVQELGRDRTHGQSWLCIRRATGTDGADSAARARALDRLHALTLQYDEIRPALAAAQGELATLRQSRLLGFGRRLRRALGLTQPY